MLSLEEIALKLPSAVSPKESNLPLGSDYRSNNLFKHTQSRNHPINLTSSSSMALSNHLKLSFNKESRKAHMKHHYERAEADYSLKQLRLLQECQSSDYLEQKQKLRNIKGKLETFKREKVLQLENQAPFNLKALINKVKSITMLNQRSKIDIPIHYRNYSISHKKDSKSVEDYLRLEKSIEDINLQHLILNVEYDNRVNRIKQSVISHNSSNSRSFHHQKPSKNHSSPKNIAKTKCYTNTHANTHSNTNVSTTTVKSPKRKSIMLKLPGNPNRRGSILITEMDRQYENRRDFNQEQFLHKYKQCIAEIQSETKEHVNKKVFPSYKISALMKSKKDLVLDSLKNEYVQQYNESIEIKKQIDKRNYINYKNETMGNKPYKNLKIEKKIEQAITQFEEGNRKAIRYQIKDYLKNANDECLFK